VVKQRGKTWQVDLTEGGQRIRKSFPTRAEAQEYEQTVLQRVSEGLSIADAAPPPAMTMARLATLTAEKYWVGKKNEVNAVRNADAIVALIGEGVHPRDVTPAVQDALIASLRKSGNSPATINRKLAALSRMMTFAASRGIISRRPTIEREREPKGRLRWYNDEEEARILQALQGEDDLRSLIIFLADTGCRLGDALNLEWRDVTDISVRFHGTKNGDNRTVPITARVREALAGRRAVQSGPKVWGHLDYDHIRRRWEKARTAAGLGEDAILHAWRHTCASRLVQRGVPLPSVQQWLGHKTLTMTMRYAHLSPTHLTDALKVLEQRA
jgi:integrase